MAHEVIPVSGGNGSSIMASITGVNPTSFDVYTTENKPTMHCSLAGATQVTIKNYTSDTMYLFAISVSVNGVQMAVVQNVYTISYTRTSVMYYASTIAAGGEKTYNLTLLNKDTTFSSSGLKDITVTIKTYTKSSRQATSQYDTSLEFCTSKDTSAGFVQAHNPILDEIKINGGGQRKYYIGDNAIDTTTLDVRANYRYYVADVRVNVSDYLNKKVNGWEIIAPLPDFSSAGIKQVYVRYKEGGYTRQTNYNITVIQVIDWGTKPCLSGNFKLDSEPPTFNENVTVKFGYNNTVVETQTLPVTFSGWNSNSKGTKTLTYRVNATDSGEHTSYTADVYICDYELYIQTNPTTLNYSYGVSNSDLDKTNMVVVGRYLDKNGTAISSSALSYKSIDNSDLTLSKSNSDNWKVGLNKGTIIVSENNTDRTTSYKVNVNGISEITIDTDNVQKQFYLGEGDGAGNYTGLVVYYKEYTNGTESVQQTYNGQVTVTGIDTNSIGNKTVTVQIAEDYIPSEEYEINVYELKNLITENQPARIVIKEGEGAKVELGDAFKIKADYDNGENQGIQTIPPSRYTVTPAVGTAITTATVDINIKAYYDEGKTALIGEIDFELPVDADRPDPSADNPIIVEGELTKTTYREGEELSIDGLTIKAALTYSGLVNIPVSPTSIKIRKLGSETELDPVFTSSMDYGEYEILIYIDNIEEPYVLTARDDDDSNGAVHYRRLVSIKTARFHNGATQRIGDKLVQDEITVIGVYSNGDEETLTGVIDKVKLGDHSTGTEVTDYTFSYSDITTNEIRFTVYYGDLRTNLWILIKYVVSISVTNTHDEYLIGDNLDINALTVTKTYSNSDVEVIENENIAKEIEDSKLSISFSGGGTGCAVDGLIPNDNRTTASVNVVFGYQEGDYTGVSNVSKTIYVKALSSIVLQQKVGNTYTDISSISKDKYTIFSLTGYYVHRIFNDSRYDDERPEITTDDRYDYKNERITAKHTDAKIYSRCGSETKNYTYTIHYVYLKDITVTFTAVTTRKWYIGDTLDVSGVTATKTVASSDSNVSDVTTSIDSGLVITFNGQNAPWQLSTVRESPETPFELKVSYTYLGDTISKTQGIYVHDDVIEELILHKAAGFKNLSSYIDGENLDFTGLTVTTVYSRDIFSSDSVYAVDDLVCYNHKIWKCVVAITTPSAWTGTTNWEEVSEGRETHSISNSVFTIVGSNGRTYGKWQELVKATDNSVELRVQRSYKNDNVLSASNDLGTLSIASKVLDHIEITQNPTKTNYHYGEKFSLNGIAVKAVYNNGKSESVNINSLVLDNGVAIGHTFTPTADGSTFTDGKITATVDLTYEIDGVSDTVTLTYYILKPIIDHLYTNVNNIDQPVKVRFVDGDTFSSTGLVVTAVFTGGYEETLTIDPSTDMDLTSLHLDTNGKIQLHNNGVPYGGCEITITGTNPYNSSDSQTVKYTVNVVTSGAIKSAIVKREEGYDSYLVGDVFDAHGITIETLDVDDKPSFGNTDFTTSIQKGTVLRKAQRITVIINYSNGSFVMDPVAIEIVVSIPNKTNLIKESEYKLAIGYYSNGNLIESLLDKDGNEIRFGKQYEDGVLIGETYPLFDERLVGVDTNTTHVDQYDVDGNLTKMGTLGYNVYTGANAQEDIVGYIDLGINIEGEVVKKAHVVLFDDPVNPIEGNGNIEVTFPHYVEGYADRINHCQFGRIFHNCLFVAGNPNFRNCDWHSGDVNVGQLKENYDNVALHDLTYFSDLDYCYYGNQETAIVGYDQYRDGDLIVIKEGSRNQATIYRREYKLVEATAYDGSSVGENLYEEAFPMFDVNSNGGVGGLSHRSIANFVGETLVLTKDGLKAITNKENAYGNMKFTYDVSSYINPAITKEDLANGILYAFGEKLLLKTNRGLYVGYNELRNDENEYEWYFLNNIEADLFFVIDDELYFANDNGEVFRFPLKEDSVTYTRHEIEETGHVFFAPNYANAIYKDRKRTFVGAGGCNIVSTDEGKFLQFSVDYTPKLVEGASFNPQAKYTFSSVDYDTLLHASLGFFIEINTRQNYINNPTDHPTFDISAYVGVIDKDNNQITIEQYKGNGTIDEERMNVTKNLFYNGRVIYFDKIQGPNAEVSTNEEYYLKKVSPDKDVYKIYNSYDQEVSLSGIETCRLSFAVNDLSITTITNVVDGSVEGSKMCQLIGDHDLLLDLIDYDVEGKTDENNATPTYRYFGVITNEDNVKAYFETAPYAMGSIVSLKTIWSWTIVNDTALAGYMDVGFFASRKQGDYDIAVKSVPNSNGFDFSKYSFATVEFLNRKLPATYGRTRTVPSVAYIRYLFKNFEDSNIVLTTLNVVYTIANFLKGVK